MVLIHQSYPKWLVFLWIISSIKIPWLSEFCLDGSELFRDSDVSICYTVTPEAALLFWKGMFESVLWWTFSSSTSLTLPFIISSDSGAFWSSRLLMFISEGSRTLFELAFKAEWITLWKFSWLLTIWEVASSPDYWFFDIRKESWSSVTVDLI